MHGYLQSLSITCQGFCRPVGQRQITLAGEMALPAVGVGEGHGRAIIGRELQARPVGPMSPIPIDLPARGRSFTAPPRGSEGLGSELRHPTARRYESMQFLRGC